LANTDSMRTGAICDHLHPRSSTSDRSVNLGTHIHICYERAAGLAGRTTGQPETAVIRQMYVNPMRDDSCRSHSGGASWLASRTRADSRRAWGSGRSGRLQWIELLPDYRFQARISFGGPPRLAQTLDQGKLDFHQLSVTLNFPQLAIRQIARPDRIRSSGCLLGHARV